MFVYVHTMLVTHRYADHGLDHKVIGVQPLRSSQSIGRESHSIQSLYSLNLWPAYKILKDEKGINAGHINSNE
jgi:hypothetical protein